MKADKARCTGDQNFSHAHKPQIQSRQ
jgi:hypothetical protein